MDNVIHGNFKRARMTLRQARNYLGGGFFRKALFEWSLEELDRTVYRAGFEPSDAYEAYIEIQRFRLAHTKPDTNGPLAEVIQFPIRKKVA